MIVRSFLTGVFSAIFLLVGLLPTSTRAQSPINLVVQQTLPKATLVKYPDVAVANRNVGISGSSDRSVSKTWTKTVDQTTFGDPTELGSTGGFQDYINTAVGGRSDGVLTYAWLTDDDRNASINVRQRYANGTLSGEVTAVGPGQNKVYVDVASNNAGTTVIAWNENARFRYAYSTGGNINQWFGPGLVTNLTSLARPHLAVGPNNIIGITFGNPDGDIFYGLWNGSSFDIETVANTGNYEADPSLTYLPNGTPVVAWRRVEGGYFYAKRAGVNNWPASRLSNDTVVTIAAISADEAGNLTFAWLQEGDAGRLKVAYATASEVFSGPVLVAQNSFRPNPSLASTVTDRTQIHLVLERWGGDSLQAEYFMLTAQGAGTMGAQPTVSSSKTLNGVPIVGGSSSFSVGFSNVTGTPNQLRYRWGAAPNDSNGWVSFTNPISVAVDSLVNTADCRAETLYTQVRSSTVLESSAKQVSVIVDRTVNSSLRVVNPNIGNKAPVFTNAADGVTLDIGTNSGASDGDPNYSRAQLFYLEAIGTSDCVGLSQFRYGTSANTLGSPYGIVDDTFANMLAMPNSGDTSQGPRTIFVRLTDGVGNVLDYTTTITYDTIKPVLDSGASLSITANAKVTTLARLSFSNVSINQDEAYPGGYWGVWVANSLTSVADPLNSTTLNWTPAEIDERGASPVLEDWSLLTGLNRTAKSFTGAQTFYVYVRFLDGAGNPTDRVVSAQINLQQVTGPTTYVPMVRR